MQRGQFTFYGSFFKAIQRIRKKTARADAYDAICAYALEGILPDFSTLDDAAAIAFDLIKPNLDAGGRKARGAKRATATRTASQKDTDTPQIHHSCPTDTPRKKENEIEKELEIELETENECYSACREQTDAFDAFWAAYPKKVGKAAAREAFAGISVPVQTLLDALDRQKASAQWQEEGGRYIPNAATWLNQSRWEDQLPVPKNPTAPSGKLGQAELDNIRRLLAEG